MARRKKRHVEELDKSERWLISYADFITLLFGFFVVMYSISSVNNEQYKVLSESLEQAFQAEKNKIQNRNGDEQIPIGQVPTVIQPIMLDNPTTEEIIKRQQLSDEILQERRQLKEMSENLEDVLSPYIKDDLVAVKRHDFWVELEMNSELLFSSGEAELSDKALPVIRQVAKVIQPLPNVVNIEGHTDNIPIDTVEYPSNWDLSSARATSMVRELINNDIPATRLSAVGYGEFHPVADNKSESGRFRNRRVVLVLMSQAFARYGMNDEERAKVLNFERSERATSEEESEP